MAAAGAYSAPQAMVNRTPRFDRKFKKRKKKKGQKK
jgi:hypothetical protein